MSLAIPFLFWGVRPRYLFERMVDTSENKGGWVTGLHTRFERVVSDVVCISRASCTSK